VKLYDIKGRLVNKSVTKYRINWEADCRSKFQYEVKQFFKTFWYGQICYEEFPVYGTRMKVDLINMTKRIAVESHGAQHESFNKFFHNNSRANYLRSITRDYDKVVWLENNDFKVLEIFEEDLASLSKKYIMEKFEVSI
jgi:hypothetical protein|tara:strand:+ start:16153 stop:16569 length:417 start_codon:yes stop_codon:yes gene_type:complete